MKLFRFLTAAAVFATGSVAFGTTVFFSTDGFGEGASLGNPDISYSSVSGAASTDLHIYIVPDASDAPFIGISLGVRSTTPTVANMTAFSVNNFDLVIAPGTPLGQTRWNAVIEPSGTVDRVSNLNGISINQAGLAVFNDGVGSPNLDKGYDATADAFYFGKVTLDPVGIGTSDYFLMVGDIGVARAGDKPQPTGPTVSLIFGASESTPVLGDDFGASGSVYDARVTVIPEPSSAVLLLCATLAFGFRRRKN